MWTSSTICFSKHVVSLVQARIDISWKRTSRTRKWFQKRCLRFRKTQTCLLLSSIWSIMLQKNKTKFVVCNYVDASPCEHFKFCYKKNLKSDFIEEKSTEKEAMKALNSLLFHVDFVVMTLSSGWETVFCKEAMWNRFEGCFNQYESKFYKF